MLNIINVFIILSTFIVELLFTLRINKLFSIHFDNFVSKLEAFKILSMLPNYDCNQCGFKTCFEFALNIINNKCPINYCIYLDKHTLNNMMQYINNNLNTIQNTNEYIAKVLCSVTKNEVINKYKYLGLKSCLGLKLLWEGNNKCSYGCVGLGDCIKVCPVNAIELYDNYLPVIDETKCIGCGNCAGICSFNVIKLVNKNAQTIIKCQNPKAGPKIIEECPKGCIGCMVCYNICPNHAIDISNKLPQINYERCINCGICALKCPINIIFSKNLLKFKVCILSEKCDKCGICVKVCPTSAISITKLEDTTSYTINYDKCISCGICSNKCPKQAIVKNVIE